MTVRGEKLYGLNNGKVSSCQVIQVNETVEINYGRPVRFTGLIAVMCNLSLISGSPIVDGRGNLVGLAIAKYPCCYEYLVERAEYIIEHISKHTGLNATPIISDDIAPEWLYQAYVSNTNIENTTTTTTTTAQTTTTNP